MEEVRKMTSLIASYHYNNGIRQMSINSKCLDDLKIERNEKDEFIPFIEELTKEVTLLTKKAQHQFYTKLKKLSLMIIPLLAPTKITHAQEITSFPLLEKSHGIELLPPEVIDILKQLILAFGTVSVALAILFLMGAGVYRMIGNERKAREWSVNVIKGFGQVLLAPVIILILTTLTALIFKNVRGLDAFF